MINKSFLVFVLLFSIVQPAFAALVTKERKMDRHYTVQGDRKLSIENKFGQVRVNTWDKNEISVDIIISAKSKSEEKSDEMLDHVRVEESGDEGGSGNISFTTVMAAHYSLCCGDELKIDYVINMPRSNPLEVRNKFGDVFVGDFAGPMLVDMSYGALTVQHISGSGKDIKVAFGSADIENVESADITMSYSRLTIDKAQNIVVSNKFGKSKINSVKDLDITQRYGDLEIGSVNKIGGSAEYAGVSIDKVTRSADMSFKYCGKVSFGAFDRSVDLVRLHTAYSSVQCSFEPDASLSLDFDITYGDLKSNSNAPALSDSQMGYTRNHYRGKIGAGAGTVNIDMKYGNLTLK